MQPEQVIQHLHDSTRQVNQSGLWHDEQLRIAQAGLQAIQQLRQELKEAREQLGQADNKATPTPRKPARKK